MKDTQIREDQGDMTTKCRIVSEIGSWNRKKRTKFGVGLITVYRIDSSGLTKCLW